MVVKALLSEDEYLDMSFDGPEPDYVDGVLVERAMPNTSHSRVNKNITKAMMPWDDRGELMAHPEIRVRVGARKFRVVDLAYFTANPTTEIPTEPPYVAIEVVSPSDRYDEIVAKLKDYESIGVPFIFLADPHWRSLSRYQEGNFLSVPALEIPSHDVSIPIEAIFASLPPPRAK
jgi:Uma2 family endonuclease